jgi:hypothetical protein
MEARVATYVTDHEIVISLVSRLHGLDNRELIL